MILSVSYPELQQLVSSKTGMALSVNFIDYNVLGLGAKVPVLGTVEIHLRYLDFDGHNLRLQLVNGALNAIVLRLVGFINNRIGKEVLSRAADDVLNVSLAAFPKAAHALRNIDVRSIDFNPHSVDLDLQVR